MFNDDDGWIGFVVIGIELFVESQPFEFPVWPWILKVVGSQFKVWHQLPSIQVKYAAILQVAQFQSSQIHPPAIVIRYKFVVNLGNGGIPRVNPKHTVKQTIQKIAISQKLGRGGGIFLPLRWEGGLGFVVLEIEQFVDTLSFELHVDMCTWRLTLYPKPT